MAGSTTMDVATHVYPRLAASIPNLSALFASAKSRQDLLVRVISVDVLLPHFDWGQTPDASGTSEVNVDGFDLEQIPSTRGSCLFYSHLLDQLHTLAFFYQSDCLVHFRKCIAPIIISQIHSSLQKVTRELFSREEMGISIEMWRRTMKK
jgi:hypothetical protein